MERDFLYDEFENCQTRFVSFVTENGRYDLAVVQTERFFGKQMVLNLQNNRYAIIGHDDVDAPGYLEEVFSLSPEAAADLREYLRETI